MLTGFGFDNNINKTAKIERANFNNKIQIIESTILKLYYAKSDQYLRLRPGLSKPPIKSQLNLLFSVEVMY